MLKTCFVWAANHKDRKHSKLAKTDSSTFSEKTPLKEGKNLLQIMCTLDAVMTRRPRFYD